MAVTQEQVYEPTQAEIDEYIQSLEQTQFRIDKGDSESRQRIKKWMGACLICVALLIDGIEALLTFLAIGVFLSPVISIAGGFLFWLWFQLLGVSYMSNPKRITVMAITWIAEIIPGLDVIPILSFLWTIGIFITILLTRAEDRGGALGAAASAASLAFKKRAAKGGGKHLVTIKDGNKRVVANEANLKRLYPDLYKQ